MGRREELIGLVVASYASSLLLVGEGKRDVKYTDIDPGEKAFSIWFFLYLMVVREGIKEGRRKEASSASTFLGGSLFITVLWSVFFWTEKKGASFFSLLLSFLLCLEGARRGGGEAYQLLSGWLLLATCLNLLIWRDERRDDALTLLRSACLATSLLSVSMKMPFFPLPVAWGVAWMERVDGRERGLLVLLLSGGSCLSLLR